MCAAILTRLTFDELGPVTVVILGSAIVLCLWVFLESRNRYRRAAGPQRRPRGGRAPMAITVATVLLCGTEIVVLLRH